MQIRRVVSLSLGFCLVAQLVTSIVLYILPQGRVAYWANWHLWGLTKDQWGNLHVNLGFLMVVAGLLHVWYNWRSIMVYLKNKARQLKVATPEFNVALALVVVVAVGTWAEAPPLVWIQHLSDRIKADAAVTYGEPPYGHAEESSLRVFLRNVDLDPVRAKANLAAAGIEHVDGDAAIVDIAGANGLTPQELYVKMLGTGQEQTAGPRPLPSKMPRGTGRKTLAAFCGEYGCDVEQAVAVLQAAGVDGVAGPDLQGHRRGQRQRAQRDPGDLAAGTDPLIRATLGGG